MDDPTPDEPDEGSAWRIVLAYDGRDLFGWQRLKDKPTVQGALEAAVAQAFGEQVVVQGAGRTDRGAHAEGQAAGFTLTTSAPSPAALVDRLNAALPPAIHARDARRVPPSFHVRTAAVGKLYEYRIHNHPDLPAALAGRVWHVPGRLDVPAMRQALPALLGRHDFASFATKPRFAQRSTVRTITGVELEVDGTLLTFRFSAESFLYHMVRNVVRALVKVGEGRYEPARIASILRARDRSASPGSAPASGLYLMRVDYPEDGPPPSTATARPGGCIDE